MIEPYTVTYDNRDWPGWGNGQKHNINKLLQRLYADGDGGSNWLAHLVDRVDRFTCEPGEIMHLQLRMFISTTRPHPFPLESFTRSSNMAETTDDILTEEAVTIIRAIANLYAEGADPYYREKLYKIANLTTHAERNALVQEMVDEAQAKSARSPKARVLITEIAKWRLLGTPPPAA